MGSDTKMLIFQSGHNFYFIIPGGFCFYCPNSKIIKIKWKNKSRMRKSNVFCAQEFLNEKQQQKKN